MEYVVAALAPFAWRFRGGWLHDQLGIEGNFPGRFVWAVVSATWVTFAFDAPYWIGAICLIGGYLGASLGHRSYIAAGRDVAEPIDGERHENWAILPRLFETNRAIDWSGLVSLGVMRGALAGGAILVLGADQLGAVGLVIVAYIVGHWGYITAAETDWKVEHKDWIARAEWFAGVHFGLAFAATSVLY